MAEQKHHPELTVMQIPLTEDSALDSIKPGLIKKCTSVTHQSSQKIDKVSPKIVLATLNARYFHTSFGLPKQN